MRQEWVYRSEIPSYRLEYDLQARPEGGVLLTGTLYQEGVPDDWFMPVPVVFEVGKNQRARTTVYANGPPTHLKVVLPAEPRRVLLDPDLWILSIKTSESRIKR